MPEEYINQYGELVLSEDSDESTIDEEELIPNYRAIEQKQNAKEAKKVMDFVLATKWKRFSMAETEYQFEKILKVERELRLLEKRIKNKFFFGKRGRHGRLSTWNRGVTRILLKYGKFCFYSDKFGFLMVCPNIWTNYNKWGQKNK